MLEAALIYAKRHRCKHRGKSVCPEVERKAEHLISHLVRHVQGPSGILLALREAHQVTGPPLHQGPSGTRTGGGHVRRPAALRPAQHQGQRPQHAWSARATTRTRRARRGFRRCLNGLFYFVHTFTSGRPHHRAALKAGPTAGLTWIPGFTRRGLPGRQDMVLTAHSKEPPDREGGRTWTSDLKESSVRGARRNPYGLLERSR